MSHPFKNKKPDTDAVTYSRDMALIKHTLKSAMAVVYEPKGRRSAKLRSSSLPYCPLEDLYRHVEESTGGFQDSYSSLAYTRIGTVIHHLLQNWLPAHSDEIEIIGMWGVDAPLPCLRVKKDGTQAPAKACPMRDRDGNPVVIGLDSMGCPQCGKMPSYEEVDSDSTFTSHTDWIWRIKGTNRVYILDIKTSSLINVYKHRRDPSGSKYPQYNYVAQIDSYIVQLEKRLRKMGFEIWGSLLIYIPRDRPTEFEPVQVQRMPSKKWIKAKRRLLDKVAIGYTKVTEQLLPSNLSKLEQGTVLDIEQHKLCNDRDDYLTNYDPRLAYKENEPCPLLDVCFKRKKLLKTFDKAVAERNAISAAKKSRKP